MNKFVLILVWVFICPYVFFASAKVINHPHLTEQSQAHEKNVTWDNKGMLVNGKRIAPVMGEIHYSRIPADEWQTEIRKMKQGGVTMIATYVFWNHIEEQEGVFDWSGQRCLNDFIKVCKEEDMPLIVRLGPFCHGEVRNGGIPDWFFSKGVKSRSEDPAFLEIVQKLYRQIFTQIRGYQWKDGGPVIAVQFDNEYRGHGSYLMALKKIALELGYDLPFYTRTGWPELRTPVPFGEMIPLYGDYADGFWERSLKPTAGNYYKAFFFQPNRDSKSIASEQMKYANDSNEAVDQTYPYFTCELGGGMLTAYHRRPLMYPEDAYAMAIVKLGSGSNLLGYYMYHGGTNPEGKDTYLNENQKTQATNYNDVPVKSYEFQSPLGEFGQKHDSYYMLRPLHFFMHDFGGLLAPMTSHFPNNGNEIIKGDDTYLRWCYRSDGNSAFVFFNNYERLQALSAKKDIRFDVCGESFPQEGMTIPAGAVGIFPVNIMLMGMTINYATAQLIAQKGDSLLFMPIEGISPVFKIDGKVIKNPRSTLYKKKGKSIVLLNRNDIDNISITNDFSTYHTYYSFEKKPIVTKPIPVSFEKVKNAGTLRTITMGINGVAEEPSDTDFEAAAVYKIYVGKSENKCILSINYRGDCARLYVDGKLIEDNFYNGLPMEYGLWRLPKGTTELELRILPLQKNEPVYFPQEANLTEGEEVISIISRSI